MTPPTGSGQPMDTGIQRYMESRFRKSFDDVRVHTGQPAHTAAAGINANAFTAGSDIYFASGQFAPHTSEGRRLLAHELTHTLHQRRLPGRAAHGPPKKLTVGFPHDPMELEADAAADRVVGGENEVTVAGATLVPLIQRDDADAGVPDSGTAGAATGNHQDDSDRALRFEGMSLTTYVVTVRSQLEGYLQDHGLEAARGLVGRFDADLERRRFENSPTYLSDVSGVPDWIEENRRLLALMEEIAPIFRAETPKLVREADEFLEVFEIRARGVLAEMLGSSEERILAERERYGLSLTSTPVTKVSRGDFGESYRETTLRSDYSMGRNSATAGLSAAALQLISKARDVRARMDDQNELIVVVTGGEEAQSLTDQAAYNRAGDRVKDALRVYNQARFQAESDYPILAAYTPLDITGTYYVDSTIEHLSQIAAGPSTQLATTLYDETAEKLANIDKVFQAVATGELKVWKLPSVVGATRQLVSMLPTGVEIKLVDDKVAEAESEGAILHLALAVLALVLGALAAIPTGGSSLAAGVAAAGAVGGAAISSYLALEHLQQYSLEAAANGTDFDKARAVSQVEPSLFWLALDIVGAVFDIHSAATAFRTLATTIREALAARKLAEQGERVAESEELLRRLSGEGDRYAPGAGLGRRLTEEVTHRGAALEAKSAAAHWESTLNPHTRAYLVDNPEVRALYHDMDDQIRSVFTHCSDNCLISNITRAQVARVRAAMERAGPEELERLNIYLHVRKNDVERAIADLDRVADQEGMRALFNRTLTEVANPPTAPLLGQGAATAARNSPGVVTGGANLPARAANWLTDTGGGAGLIPGQVAERLRGRTFATFDEFQTAFWQEVAADPNLAAGFMPQNRAIMAAGNAPFVVQSERWGEAAGGRFILHHVVPIEHGGGVYDASNLLVTSPRLHAGLIHSPTAPMAPFRQLPVGGE